MRHTFFMSAICIAATVIFWLWLSSLHVSDPGSLNELLGLQHHPLNTLPPEKPRI
jgi:hypothetical protein